MVALQKLPTKQLYLLFNFISGLINPKHIIYKRVHDTIKLIQLKTFPHINVIPVLSNVLKNVFSDLNFTLKHDYCISV
jgi:hypothetical protein